MSEPKSFRDMVPESTDKVELPDGVSIVIRGLSLDDIAKLASKHMAIMGSLYSKFTGDGAEIPTAEAVEAEVGGYEDMAVQMLKDAPRLLAEIIVTSAGTDGSEEDVDHAMRLPAPIQLQAIEKIGKLTFVGEGSVKKTLDSLLQMFRAGRTTLTHLQT